MLQVRAASVAGTDPAGARYGVLGVLLRDARVRRQRVPRTHRLRRRRDRQRQTPQLVGLSTLDNNGARAELTCGDMLVLSVDL
eukprot:5907828-Pyramimonas_sp.AAC.2